MSVHSFLELFEHLYNHFLELYQVSCLSPLSSSSGVFTLLVHVEYILLSPHFAYLAVFISIHSAGRLHFPALEELPVIEVILCIPAAHSPLSLELLTPGVSRIQAVRVLPLWQADDYRQSGSWGSPQSSWLPSPILRLDGRGSE